MEDNNMGKYKKDTQQPPKDTEIDFDVDFTNSPLWKIDGSVQKMSYLLVSSAMLLKSDILHMMEHADTDIETEQQLRDLSHVVKIVFNKDSNEYKEWMITRHRVRAKLTERKYRARKSIKNNIKSDGK